VQMTNLPDRQLIAALPPQVERLAAREREVAAVVYSNGPSTANEVKDRLSDKISNGAVRSMLMRLVAKGVLRRRKRGRGQAFVYIPAITGDHLKSHAIQTLALEYFNGSLADLIAGIADLMRGMKGTRATGNPSSPTQIRPAAARSMPNDRVSSVCYHS
jgi:predicted transcriptional regulator